MERFEENLNALADLLENTERTKLGKPRVMISEDAYEEILDIVAELLDNIPAEFKSSKDVLKRKEEIIKNAKADASEIIADAENRARELVTETEVYRLAKETIAQEEQEYVDKIQQYVADAYSFVDEKLADVDKNILEYSLQIEQQIKQNSEVLAKMNEYSQLQLQSTKDKFDFISSEIFEARKNLR